MEVKDDKRVHWKRVIWSYDLGNMILEIFGRKCILLGTVLFAGGCLPPANGEEMSETGSDENLIELNPEQFCSDTACFYEADPGAWTLTLSDCQLSMFDEFYEKHTEKIWPSWSCAVGDIINVSNDIACYDVGLCVAQTTNDVWVGIYPDCEIVGSKSHPLWGDWANQCEEGLEFTLDNLISGECIGTTCYGKVAENLNVGIVPDCFLANFEPGEGPSCN